MKKRTASLRSGLIGFGWNVSFGLLVVRLEEDRARRGSDDHPHGAADDGCEANGHIVGQLASGQAPGSDLARLVGAKGYHGHQFEDGPYPV